MDVLKISGCIRQHHLLFVGISSLFVLIKCYRIHLYQQKAKEERRSERSLECLEHVEVGCRLDSKNDQHQNRLSPLENQEEPFLWLLNHTVSNNLLFTQNLGIARVWRV